MDNLLQILMMTLAPILAKNFFPSNNNNAVYTNQETDPVTAVIQNGIIKGNDKSGEGEQVEE